MNLAAVKKLLIVLGMVLAGAFGFGLSQSRVPGTPAHATAKASGNGWRCDPGYRELAAGCIAGVSANFDQQPTKQADSAAEKECEFRASQEIDLMNAIEILSLENAILRSSLDDGG